MKTIVHHLSKMQSSCPASSGESVGRFHLAPLAGRGRSRSAAKASGEGDPPRVQFAETPPHPALRADLSPQAGRGKESLEFIPSAAPMAARSPEMAAAPRSARDGRTAPDRAPRQN